MSIKSKNHRIGGSKGEGDGCYFYADSKVRNTAFSFPSATAGLTFGLMKKLGMEPGLRRFAQRLYDQLLKRESQGGRLVGIEITGIDFICLYDADMEKKV